MKADECKTMRDVYAYGYEIGMRDDAQSGDTVVLPTLKGDGGGEIVKWFNVYSENTARDKNFMAGFLAGCKRRDEVKARRLADRKAIRRKFAHARSRTLRARGW